MRSPEVAFDNRGYSLGTSMTHKTFARLPAALAAGLLLAALAPAHANLLSNASFEAPDRGADTYCYMGAGCSLNGWTGDAVIIAKDSGAWGWPNQAAGYAFGDQLVGLQTSLMVAQTVNLAAGQYTLDWADSARRSYYNQAFYGAASYQVLFDNLLLGTYDVQPGEAWARNTLSFAANGAGELRFQGLFLDTDTTAFIDDVVLTASTQVPEPQALALVLVALLGAGAAGRRKTMR